MQQLCRRLASVDEMHRLSATTVQNAASRVSHLSFRHDYVISSVDAFPLAIDAKIKTCLSA